MATSSLEARSNDTNPAVSRCKQIACLFGFIAQISPTAYVHLVDVHKDFQHRGLGSALYAHFIDYGNEKGGTKLKAITAPSNSLSIDFHKNMGMHLLGETNADVVEVVRAYSGIGQDYVVVEKEL